MNAGQILKELRERNDRRWPQNLLAEWLEVSPSLINLIETGKRKISKKLLYKIEREEIFDVNEFSRLQAAVLSSIEATYGIVHAAIKQFDLESTEILIEDIHELRLDGQTSPSIRLLPRQIDWLLSIRDRYPRDRRRFDQQIGKAIFEWIDTLTETNPQSYDLTKLDHYLAISSNVRYALKDLDIMYYEMSLLLEANVLYVTDQLPESMRIFTKYNNEVSSSRAKASCVRNIPLIMAKLASRGQIDKSLVTKEYERREDMALNIAQQNNINLGDQALIFEGVSYARGLLHFPGADELLETARHRHRHGFELGVSRVYDTGGLLRTEFSNLTRNPQDLDIKNIILAAERGIELFDRIQAIRRKKQIIAELVEFPNREIQEFGMSLL